MLAIYARISGVKEDDQDVSIPFQINQGKSLASKLDLDFKIYKDEGVSGTTDPEERKGLTRLLLDIVSGEITVVYAWQQYRLYRSESARLKVQTVCKRHGVRIFYNTEEYQYDDPTAKMIDTIMAATGQFYVDLTKQHVKGVIRQNFEEGKAHGETPYGYMKDKDKKLVPDPDEAKIIKDVFTWNADGQSLPQITKRLNNLNVLTRRGAIFTKSTLSKLIANPTYIGERPFLDSFVPIPAIIDKELFEKAKRERRKLITEKASRQSDRFYLNGLVNCRSCDNRYLGNSTQYSYYMCATKRDKRGCKSKNVLSSFLEDFIWYILINELPNEVYKLSNEDSGKDELIVQQSELREKLAVLDEEMKRQADLVVRGLVGVDILETISKRIINDKDLVHKKLEDVQELLRGYENPDLDILNVDDSKQVSNALKKVVANTFIMWVDISEEGGFQRVDIQMKTKSIRLSFIIDAKKGLIVDRLRPNIYIRGKMLVRELNKTQDLTKFWLNDNKAYAIHEYILRCSDNYTDSEIRFNQYDPRTYDSKTSKTIEDRYARTPYQF